MARFVFKLEGVLRQRQHEEQQRQRDLAERQMQLVGLQEELKRLNNDVQATNEEVRRNHLVGRLDMNYLAAHRRFLAAMQRQAIGTMQRITLAQRAVEEARAQLGEAAKRRKIIEKLRDRQRERWRAEQARRELADLDEIGTQIACRNLAGDEMIDEGAPA